MRQYLIKKVMMLIPLLLALSFTTFTLTYLSPSDPVTLKYSRMGIQPDRDLVAKEKEALGLNDPFLQQYGRWLGNVLTGDLGESYKYGEPVMATLRKRLPKTLVLTATTIISTIAIALPLGILIAVKQNSWVDYGIRILSFLGVSMPSFWVGTVLMYVFGVRWQLLPIIGDESFRHLILPTATLTFWMVSLYVRRVRSAILEEWHQDYVTGAKALGLSDTTILWRQVVPNAMLAILTSLGISVGSLLGGATVVEYIFEWKGIGNMALEAIAVKDFPVLQAYVLWMGIIYLICHLAVDLLCFWIDPHLRLGVVSDEF